jgi:hypothetical protein
MPQLHFYVPEEVARLLRARARAAGLSVSRYIAAVVRAGAAPGWPAGYFEEVVGGWRGEPLRRPAQGRSEEREAL